MAVFITAPTFTVLRQLAIIALILTMLGQSFSNYLMLLNYELNKDYIAQNLCENKDKPQLKCQGKCYLCKKVQEETKKDQENSERSAAGKFEVLLSHQDFCVEHPALYPVTMQYPSLVEKISGRYKPACFHPPRC